MTEWYYQRGETQFGPLSAEHLKAVWQRGQLTDDTLVRRLGAESWVTLSCADFTETPSEEASISLPADPNEKGIKPPLTLRIAVYLALTAILLVCLLECLATALLVQAKMLATCPPWALEAGESIRLAAPWLHLAFLITLVLWQGAAFSSLGGIYERGFLKRSSWSGLWWIIPFANLFMPFVCLFEMQGFSEFFSTKRRIGNPSGQLLWFIEVSLILCLVLEVLLFQNVPTGTPSHTSGAINLNSFQILSVIQNISLTIFAASIGYFILTNYRQQSRLYIERHR